MIERLKPRIAQANLSSVRALTADTQRMRGRRLQERNRRFKRANPLCACCSKQGRVSATTEVDHVIPLHLGGPDHESNLQGLCYDCHQEKTAAEAKDRGGASQEGVGGQISGASKAETDSAATQGFFIRIRNLR